MNKQTEALKLALVKIRAAQMCHPNAVMVLIDEAEEVLAEALAEESSGTEQPAQDNTYGYAKSLAETIFKQHFARDEHYASGRIVWEVNNTVIGILTQIDNMVADMVRRPAIKQDLTPEQPAQPQQEPVAVALQFRSDGRLCLSTVFDTMAEAQEYASECSSKPIAVPLYTSPPASQSRSDVKPWVGLTDEEVKHEWVVWRASIPRYMGFAKGIEAKLRKKNA